MKLNLHGVYYALRAVISNVRHHKHRTTRFLSPYSNILSDKFVEAISLPTQSDDHVVSFLVN